MDIKRLITITTITVCGFSCKDRETADSQTGQPQALQESPAVVAHPGNSDRQTPEVHPPPDPSRPSSGNPFKTSGELNLFRNYALSVCIGMAYEKDSTKLAQHLSHATNGYMEFGNMSLEGFDEARKLAAAWLKKDYKSKSGEQIDFMKCVDMYNSTELLELFKAHDPCKTKEGWITEERYLSACQ